MWVFLYIRHYQFLPQHKVELLKMWFGDLCTFVECLLRVSYETNAKIMF